jgi:hypothetical protein
MNFLTNTLIKEFESYRTKDPVEEFDLIQVRKFSIGAFGHLEKKVLFAALKSLVTTHQVNKEMVEELASLLVVEAFVKHYPDVQAMIDSIKDMGDKLEKGILS